MLFSFRKFKKQRSNSSNFNYVKAGASAVTTLIAGSGYGTGSGVRDAAEELGLRVQTAKRDGFEALGVALSDATLICLPPGRHSSAMLEQVQGLVTSCSTPMLGIDLNASIEANAETVREWLSGLPASRTLHIVGPLEAHAHGCHDGVRDVLLHVLAHQEEECALQA
jgi:hypothetical protein